MSLTEIEARTLETTDAVKVAEKKAMRAERRLRKLGDADASEIAGRRGGSRWVVIIGLVLFTFYAIAPAWWLIVSATKSKQQLFTTSGLWFGDFSLFNNVGSLFTYQHGIFSIWLWNSTLYAVVGSAGQTIVALAAGYGLAMYTFKGRGTTMAFIIGSFLVPGALLTIPSYLLYVQLGIYNTMWAMIVPALFSPFSVYLAKVYTEGAMPAELMEAARIDGAGEYRIFFRIGLRLLTTAGATIFLLHFVGSWNGFFGPLVFLRDANKWPVMLGLYSWLQQGTDSTVDLTSLVITGSLVATIPMVLLMVAMQRYWKAGVTMGSLK
jgi:multiple sugar transport system permease protein